MNTQVIDVKHVPVKFNIDGIVGDDLDIDGIVRIDSVLLPWAGVTLQTDIRTMLDTAAPSSTNWAHTTPSDGHFTLSLTSAQTTLLGPNTYQWWMTLTIGGKQRTYFVGRLRLNAKASAQ